MYVEKDWGHVLPIDGDADIYGTSNCQGEDSSGLPVSNCGYDAAGIVLAHLLTNIPGTGIDEL